MEQIAVVARDICLFTYGNIETPIKPMMDAAPCAMPISYSSIPFLAMNTVCNEPKDITFKYNNE